MYLQFTATGIYVRTYVCTYNSLVLRMYVHTLPFTATGNYVHMYVRTYLPFTAAGTAFVCTYVPFTATGNYVCTCVCTYLRMYLVLFLGLWHGVHHSYFVRFSGAATAYVCMYSTNHMKLNALNFVRLNFHRSPVFAIFAFSFLWFVT